MTEIVDEDENEFTLDMFNKALSDAWKYKGKKYEFLVKAGYDMKNALFLLFKKVWEEEKILKRWTKTTLLQLYKMKGNFQELKNQRNIHLKEDLVKMFSTIVMNISKEILMKNMSKFQIGTKKGHWAAEHIYVIKSVMQLYTYQRKPLILSFYDYATFFDTESILDVMCEVYKAGVKGRAYRLIYNLNENTKIKVSTPVGLSEEAIVKEIVGQGAGLSY